MLLTCSNRETGLSKLAPSQGIMYSLPDHFPVVPLIGQVFNTTPIEKNQDPDSKLESKEDSLKFSGADF
jgi:hypothetical protein